jgi:hypothetical protein
MLLNLFNVDHQTNKRSKNINLITIMAKVFNFSPSSDFSSSIAQQPDIGS